MRSLLKGLSGKLLVLTIAFVMLAELVLLVPSMALFKQNWLLSRVDNAQLLTLALQGVEDFRGSDLLNEQFMTETKVTAVVQKRQGRTEAVLGMIPADANFHLIDLREPGRIPEFVSTVRTLFGDGEGYLRVWAQPVVPDAESLELIIPNSAVKDALLGYLRNILGLSLFIALLTGSLIYLALSAMIVRPVRRLASGLSEFRQDPKRRAGNITQSDRDDEIGSLEREFIEMKSDIRQALKQQDRLATLGLAVAKINHDLRNVLTSAQLISERLENDKDPRIARMGERLIRAMDRGVKLCASVLNYSKASEDPPKPRDVRIATLVGEAAGDLLSDSGSNIRWENNIPSDLTVHADPDHAFRIFSNLLRNSAGALAEQNGNDAPLLQVDAKTLKQEDGSYSAIIRVIDNGPGLPERVKENLFKPFSAQSRGGTGLGLTISRELTQAHGGDLRLESTSDAGTVFAVVLPLGKGSVKALESKPKVKA